MDPQVSANGLWLDRVTREVTRVNTRPWVTSAAGDVDIYGLTDADTGTHMRVVLGPWDALRLADLITTEATALLRSSRHTKDTRLPFDDTTSEEIS
jgi:hypothetical protein